MATAPARSPRTRRAPNRPEAAALFHALSDETRLAIVELLADGERCVCELQDALDAAQSRLSFHLKVLKDAALVTDRREGRWSYYALRADRLADARVCIDGLTTPKRANALPTMLRRAAAATAAPASVPARRARRDACCD